jgi:hypothetical protein
MCQKIDCGPSSANAVVVHEFAYVSSVQMLCLNGEHCCPSTPATELLLEQVTYLAGTSVEFDAILDDITLVARKLNVRILLLVVCTSLQSQTWMRDGIITPVSA